MIFNSKATDGHIHIAVEIEQTSKSKVRLIRKLKKYATQSRLDGVFYICENNALSERIRHIYTSRVVEDALRIKHYGKNFLLFSDGTLDVESGQPIMFNAAFDYVSLTDWMHKLIDTGVTLRRDAKFQTPALPARTFFEPSKAKID